MSSLFRWAKRHKAIVAVGGLVGVGIGIGWWWAHQDMARTNELNEKRQKEALYSRLRLHFSQTVQSADSASLSILSQLADTLAEDLDVEKLVGAIKTQKDREQAEIYADWDHLKCLAIARTLAAVYAMTLCTIRTRIQYAIIGAALFSDASEGRLDDDDESQAPRLVRETVLNGNVESCLDACRQLAPVLEEEARKIMARYSLKDAITSGTLEDVIAEIRSYIELPASESQIGDWEASPLAKLLCINVNDETDPNPVSALLEEANQVFCSANFRTVITRSLDAAFAHLLESLDTTLSEKTVLPKAIPHINNQFVNIMASIANSYHSSVVDLPVVDNFCSVIYFPAE